MPDAANIEKFFRAGNDVLDPMTNAQKLVSEVIVIEDPERPRESESLSGTDKLVGVRS